MEITEFSFKRRGIRKKQRQYPIAVCPATDVKKDDKKKPDMWQEMKL